MRFTRLLASKFSGAYERVTLNRITTAFFLFTFVHCFGQGTIQSLLFSIDSDYTSILTGIVNAAGIPSNNITFIQGPYDNLRLRMCNDIPYGLQESPCTNIFPVPLSDIVTPLDDSPLWHNISQAIGYGLDASPIQNPLNVSEANAVKLTDRDGNSIILPDTCTGLFLYPKQILYNLWREDLTLILLQFWLFAISVIGLMKESVPHILAVLSARTLLSGWSMYAVWRTGHYKRQFNGLIYSPNSPCQLNLFGDFFTTQMAYEIPNLILNIIGICTAGYLSCILLKTYNTQSFKPFAAPERILRINKFFMAMLACLQLEVFVLSAAVGLWLDVLFNTAIKKLSEHTGAYDTLSILTAVLLIPWIATGWYAIRREIKIMLLVFLFISFLFIVGWSIMFHSIVYRATFVEWPFFGCLSVASFILIVSGMILSLVCRLNFDRGLAQYLHAEDVLVSADFAHEVFEKDEEKGGEEEYKSSMPRLTFNSPRSDHHPMRDQV